MNNEIERRELSCGGQTYSGDSGTGLRPGLSLSSMCSEGGSSSPSTTRQEAETGMTSGSCSAPALLSWALCAADLEGADNLRGQPSRSGEKEVCETATESRIARRENILYFAYGTTWLWSNHYTKQATMTSIDGWL